MSINFLKIGFDFFPHFTFLINNKINKVTVFFVFSE